MCGEQKELSYSLDRRYILQIDTIKKSNNSVGIIRSYTSESSPNKAFLEIKGISKGITELTISYNYAITNKIIDKYSLAVKKVKIEVIDKNINTNTNNEKNERSAYNNDNIEGKLETTNIDKKSENISQNINNDDDKAKEEKDTINKEETNIVLEKEDINSVFEVIDKDIEQEQKKEEDKENLEKLKTEENTFRNIAIIITIIAVIIHVCKYIKFER
jgi:intracellular protein transport protein USO1, putative